MNKKNVKFRKTVYLSNEIVKIIKVKAFEKNMNESEYIESVLKEKFKIDEKFI